MSSNLTTWHGTDASMEESLFVYGCLARYTPEQKSYEVIYRHPYIKGNWDSGFMKESDIQTFIQESWFKKDRFFNFIGTTETEWLKLTFIQKVNDLINWECVINFFGECCDEGLTTKEVCRKVRIAYKKSYDSN